MWLFQHPASTPLRIVTSAMACPEDLRLRQVYEAALRAWNLYHSCCLNGAHSKDANSRLRRESMRDLPRWRQFGEQRATAPLAYRGKLRYSLSVTARRPYEQADGSRAGHFRSAGSEDSCPRAASRLGPQPVSRCTQIADLTRVGQFPTLKSQTEPVQIGVKSRTVCAAQPAALLTMALLGTFPCTRLPLCQQAHQGLTF
jgi:hypothetical protein